VTTSESTKATNAAPPNDILAARFYLGRRWVLVTIAVAAVIAGLAFNWSWLVAIGVAPILLGLLPCAVMCGLGLCMQRMGSRSCTSQSSQAESVEKLPAPDQDSTTNTR